MIWWWYNIDYVQVLISTYNGERYIKEQLESIINQTYKHIKILVRDDGSTDSTIEILKSYRDNGYIELYTGDNIGVCASFFDLINKADNSCDYFAFADQDDFWLSQKIEQAMHHLKKVQKVGKPCLSFCKVTVVDENLQILEKHKSKKINQLSFGNSLIENVVTGCATVFNKQLLLKFRELKSVKGVFLHDWFAYMICSAFGIIVYDENSYILYRQHSSNVIGASKNALQNFKRKFKLLILYSKNKIIYNNIKSFYKTYSKYVNIEQRNDIKCFLNTTFYARIKNLFNKNIKRQNSIDTIIYKILIFIKII